jgi:hypothetical protein
MYRIKSILFTRVMEGVTYIYFKKIKLYDSWVMWRVFFSIKGQNFHKLSLSRSKREEEIEKKKYRELRVRIKKKSEKRAWFKGFDVGVGIGQGGVGLARDQTTTTATTCRSPYYIYISRCMYERVYMKVKTVFFLLTPLHEII